VYKAVIFDLNGVFLESQLLSQRFEDEFGIKIQDFLPVLKEVMSVVRQPNAPQAFSLWEPHFKKWGLNLSESKFFNFWFSGEKVVPELIEYAKKLHESGVKIFLFSNNFRERTNYYRQNFPEIFQNIDKAYFSWETGKVKPSSEALQALLAENNLVPQDCIYFDDSDFNISISNELGIRGEKWVNLEQVIILIEGKNHSKKAL
jgi:HAD superfamily hydrolase (TIGR01509 family)